MTSERVC